MAKVRLRIEKLGSAVRVWERACVEYLPLLA